MDEGDRAKLSGNSTSKMRTCLPFLGNAVSNVQLVDH